MNVGFLHVGPDVRLPTIAIEAVRRAMPGVKVTHMTDARTPRLDADERVELAYDGTRLMTYRMDLLAMLPDGDWLILDTDVVLREDPRKHLPGGDWDVALTRRSVVIAPDGTNVAISMPFNTGVMFSRTAQFWKDCAAICRLMPDEQQRWYGDQLAVRFVAERGGYKVQELPCSMWNFTPESPDTDLSGKIAVHYKGNRKDWMLNHGT